MNIDAFCQGTFKLVLNNILHVTIFYGPLWSWSLDLQLPVQWVSITTKVVSLNPTPGEVYSIQHYVIKFVSDLRQVSDFLRGTAVYSTNKTDCHDIIEILLQVALNTITKTLTAQIFVQHIGSFWYTLYIVKPVYKGISQEPENVAFMSSCPLHTGYNYIHYNIH